MKIIEFNYPVNPSAELRDFGLHGAEVLVETTVVRKGTPFFIPDWLGCKEGRLFVGTVINRLGKFIGEKFADRYHGRPIIGVQALPDAVILRGYRRSFAMNTDNMLMLSEEVDPLQPLKITLTKLDDKKDVILEKNINGLNIASLIDKAVTEASEGHTLHTGDVILAGYIPEIILPLTRDTRLFISQNDLTVLNHKIK